MSTWESESGVVEFPDGRRIRGTGVRAPRIDVPPPDFAIYLLARDPGEQEWPSRWVRWRDFSLPASTPLAVAMMREAHDRATSERVEIACGGGIGRTGTALALLAIMSGVPTEDAVSWVRAHYHRRAVETRWQRRWVSANGGLAGSSGRNSIRPPRP